MNYTAQGFLILKLFPESVRDSDGTRLPNVLGQYPPDPAQKDFTVSFHPQGAIDLDAMEIRTFSQGGSRTRHRVFTAFGEVLLKGYPYFVFFAIFFLHSDQKKQK